jgi:hypothetical protein
MRDESRNYCGERNEIKSQILNSVQADENMMRFPIECLFFSLSASFTTHVLLYSVLCVIAFTSKISLHLFVVSAFILVVNCG